MIDSKKISVVVQGGVDKKNTFTCLKNIKKCFPNASIILSTWKEMNVDGLSCDKIILLTAPKNVAVETKNGVVISNNTNRMIYGVQEALKQVTTPYVLKLRTDIILQDASFLQYWDKYPKRSKKFKFFHHRILNYYLFAPQFNYRQGQKIPTLFHPSDWMFFGRTEDVKKLFNVPLQPDPAYSLWWETHNKNSKQIDCWPGAVFRYAPEQYLLYHAFKQSYPQVHFNNYLDISRAKEQISRQVMVNNFVILDYRQWHIKIPKYQHLIGSIPYGQTSHSHWLLDYRRYCDSDFKISWKDLIFRYAKLNLGEILKTKQIEWEKKLITLLCPSLYLAHIRRKYANSPAKLKQKMASFDSSEKKYVYPEDIPE